MSSGEGGAVLTNDAELANRLYRFKHIGYASGTIQGKAAGGPPAGLVCHNYRGTEFQAAILRGQLKTLKGMTRRRDQNAKFLCKKLEQLPGIKVQARGRRADVQGYYRFVILVDPAYFGGASLTQIIRAAWDEGLRAGAAYGAVYRQILWNIPPSDYRIHGSYKDARGAACKVTEDVCQNRAICVDPRMLEWSRAELARVPEIFAKLQQNASELKKIK